MINTDRDLQTGIVHLGLGNFHRAHQAVYTAEALARESGPWGILGVAPRSPEVVAALRRQEHLYTVMVTSSAGQQPRIPAVHTNAIVAAHDPQAVITAIATEQTRIITLTVTENGYHLDPRTQRLNLASPAISHDLAQADTPRSAIGLLTRGLAARFRRSGEPLAVLSCDNLPSNGSMTRDLLRTFATRASIPNLDAFLEWLDTHVSFPNSMVDRIVPATTDALRQDVARTVGWSDAIPVAAEPFGMWVMEDSFPAGRPVWDQVGATFTDDVEAYELIKLRLLNGTHSLISYLGALTGCATIPDSTAVDFIRQAAHSVLVEDYLPTVRIPDGLDIDDHIRHLFERWTNHGLAHRTSEVGRDGSLKLAQRVPQPALHHLREGTVPGHLALTVAGYLCCLAPPAEFDPGPQATAMIDPARATLATLRASHSSDLEFAHAVFDTGLLGEELAERPAFVNRAAELITIITHHGAAAAAADVRSG